MELPEHEEDLCYGEIRFPGLAYSDLIEALGRCGDELEAHGYSGKYEVVVEKPDENGDFQFYQQL